MKNLLFLPTADCRLLLIGEARRKGYTGPKSFVHPAPTLGGTNEPQ